MLILSAEDVRRALPMDLAIEAMKRAFAALAGGRAVVPERGRLDIEKYDGITLMMPSFIGEGGSDALAVKIASTYSRNPARGLARIQAAVLVLEPATGRPIALCEGASLTAIRTGAASGAATDLLARPDSRVLAVLGAGVQARTQWEAVCAVRAIDRVAVYSPTRAHAEKLIDDVAGAGQIAADCRVAPSAADAVAGADIVCAATTSQTPVFDDSDLAPGVHVNAVGSFQPHAQEIPAETVCRALVVVDSREATLEETGDLIQPIRAGLFRPEQIHAELGEVILGHRPGRAHADQCTLFKSVGIAVQDTAAATTTLKNAREQNLGVEVDW